jgi:preprotein translocase subunit SecB
MTEQQKTPLEQEFIIQRIYIKDISFEAPNTPHIFQEAWKPELSLDLQTNSSSLGQDNFEVVLTVTITVKSDKKVAFLVEVKEAGIFTLKNFAEDQLKPILGSVCPAIIYPYLREVVSDIVVKGGFPQLNLAPINFDALYLRSLEQGGNANFSIEPTANSETIQ